MNTMDSSNAGCNEPADRILARYLGSDLAWPDAVPVPRSRERLRDHYRGCLLWGAVGDALGRAVEGWNPAAIRAEYGSRGLQRYVLWRGWSSGPTGTITDDTQLTMERRPGGRAIRLSERVHELADLLAWEIPEAVFAYTYNGAFALESVPAALYCFLHAPDDPGQVILTAVNAGYDADTVASMAGNLAGAWCGAERLRQDRAEWWSELEYRDELTALADGLADLALANANSDD